jgi:flavin-dependent dehydrogenase
MYDAIVVGARCAGSPTAMHLARKGYRVLLVDRETFPADIFRGHFVHNATVARWKRWGLLDRIAASNCPAIEEISLDVGPFVLTGKPFPVDGVTDCYAPRRKVLDKILIDFAAEAGAEVREAFTVEDVTWDGGRVAGIRGHGRGGANVIEDAKIVIGADGQHSTVARAVGAETYNQKFPISCGFFSYYSNLPMPRGTFFPRDGNAIVAFPTNDGLTAIAVVWPQAKFHEVRSDIEGNFNRGLQLVPELAELASYARREEPFMGSGELDNFFRKPYGPGWALVGDAGYHKDPILAQGITDAMRDSEALAEAIDAGFSGRQPLDAPRPDRRRDVRVQRATRGAAAAAARAPAALRRPAR